MSRRQRRDVGKMGRKVGNEERDEKREMGMGQREEKDGNL